MPAILCINCQTEIKSEWFFCPNCGMQLQDKPRATVVTPSKQAMIYAVSFFLAPLGLGWGLKYIRDKDPKVQRVGWIAIVLTVVALILMVGLMKSVMDSYSNILNNLGNGVPPGSFSL